MADIPIREGLTFRSTDVLRATFWEAGADLRQGSKNEPPDKAEHDTLTIEWKGREKESSTKQGPDARRIADALEQAAQLEGGFAVFFWRKK